MDHPNNPPYFESDKSSDESEASLRIKYKPIDEEAWRFFKAFEGVGTIALFQQSYRSGVPLTTRVKFDWEMRRNGIDYPQTSPNVGPYGIIPFDSYTAITELVSDGYCNLEWRKVLRLKAENSYSNFEYTDCRSRRIYPTQKIEELKIFLDRKLDTQKLIESIKILATRLGLDPINLGRRSKRILLEIVKSSHMPYSYLNINKNGTQTRLDGIFNHVGKISGGYMGGFVSIDLRGGRPSEVDRCRVACESIINQKEDQRRKPSLFLPELIKLWRRGDRTFVGDYVLYAGRFIGTPNAIDEDILRADFSTSLYLEGHELQCSVYLHQSGFDLSKMSPFGLSENIFIILGTVNGETDRQNRPIITVNALIPVEDLQPHVPRFPSKYPEYIA